MTMAASSSVEEPLHLEVLHDLHALFIHLQAGFPNTVSLELLGK